MCPYNKSSLSLRRVWVRYHTYLDPVQLHSLPGEHTKVHEVSRPRPLRVSCVSAGRHGLRPLSDDDPHPEETPSTYHRRRRVETDKILGDLTRGMSHSKHRTLNIFFFPQTVHSPSTRPESDPSGVARRESVLQGSPSVHRPLYTSHVSDLPRWSQVLPVPLRLEVGGVDRGSSGRTTQVTLVRGSVRRGSCRGPTCRRRSPRSQGGRRGGRRVVGRD